MRTVPSPIAQRGDREAVPDRLALGRRHSDGYRLAKAFAFLLFVTAIDVTNLLDSGSRIKYLILLVPVATVLLIRVRPGGGGFRRAVASDRILLVLVIAGLGGTISGVLFAGTTSPSVTLFVPMLLAFLALAAPEPLSEAEARSVLRWLLIIGLLYVVLSAAVNSGLVARLTQYRQYRNATMFFIPLGLAAALGLRARIRMLGLLFLAAIAFVAYPSGTAALIVLTTVVTLLVTRPSGIALRPWAVVLALALALMFAVTNFNKTVELTGSYFSVVGKRNNDVTRVSLWRAAVSKFEESPVIGNLFTGNTTVDVRLPTPLSPTGKGFQAPFHSDYLLFLANGGLLGLGLLLAWAAAVEVMAYRRYRAFLALGRRSSAALVRALLIGFNAYFCAMAFNPLFNGMSISACLFAMYGLMTLIGDPRVDTVASVDAEPPASRPIVRSAQRVPPALSEHARLVREVWSEPRTSNPPASPAPFASELGTLDRAIWSTSSAPAHATAVAFVAPAARPAAAASGGDGGVPPAIASARSRLAGGSRWLLLARVGTLTLGLGINALLTRLLKPQDVGSYYTTFALLNIGSTIAQLGTDRAVVRFVAAAIGRGEPGTARDAIRKLFLIASVGTLAVALALWLGLGSWLAAHIFRSAAIGGAIPLIIGCLVGITFMGLVTETLRGLQRFALTSLFDSLLVDIIMASVFAAAWIAGIHMGYGTAIRIAALSLIFAALVGLAIVGQAARRLQGAGHQPVREILAVAWPLLVTNLGLFLVNVGVDLWVLGAFRTQKEVALYGAAARLAMLVGVPFTILLSTVPPLVAELHARERRGELERMLRIMATVGAVPAVLACSVFLVAGGPIMGRFYGGTYASGAAVLAILSVSQLVAVSLGACGVTLMMTGHQRLMMLITILTGILSVTAAVLLARRFGGVGVATATASGLVVQNLLQLFFARRFVGVWTLARPSIRPLYQFVGKDMGSRRAGRR